jgi:hypothetical protein
MTKPQIIVISLLTLVLTTIACRQNKKDTSIVEGDLFFRPLRYGSFYNQPDSLIKKFVTYADTAKLDSLNLFEKEILETYHILKNENRLFSPFVELKINDSSFVKLYLDSVVYDKIKIYKRQELQASNKKIRIKAETQKLSSQVLICTKLISIDKLDGVTLQQEKKFKIDDY